MKKLLFMSLCIFGLFALTHSAEPEGEIEVTVVAEGIELHKIYSKEGLIRESISYSQDTWKPHGERRLYGPDEEVIRIQWFIHGVESDKEDFLRVRHDEKQHKREIEAQYSVFDKREGDRINNFINDLTRAWVREDQQYCKNLIEDSLEEVPNWVPGLFARFGYLMAVDRNFEGSLVELKKAWAIIENEPRDSFKNIGAQKRLHAIIPNTISLLESEIKRGTIDERKLALDYVFPGTEFIIMYSGSKGYKVSNLIEFIPQEEK